VGASRGRDFDVAVYPHGSKKLWTRARHKGRTEAYFDIIPSGKWDVKIVSRKKTGKAKVLIELL
jgi:hypothetical protein